MLANWHKQTGTVAPAGTGPITLAAVAGLPTFNSRFGINRPFQYTVLTTGELPVSSEIGYLSDATTLVRSKVLETFDGTTLNANAPTLPSLSGSYLIESAGDAGLFSATMPSVMNGGGGYSKRVCSIPAFNAGALTTSSMAAGQINYFPVFIDTASPINSLIADVTTAVAGSTFRIGLYALNGDGSIGNLIVDSGDISGATATLVSASITPLRLPPGWYVGAMIASAAIAVRATPIFTETPFGWETATARYKRCMIVQSSTYGAFPAVAPLASPSYINTGSSNGVTMIWMGLAS